MVRAEPHADGGQGREPRQITIVAAHGVTQIFAWGCSYYLPAVLATWVTSGTGWPLAWVVGGLSLGLLVAGLGSPTVGRLIQDYGGCRVLAISSILLAAGLIVVGLSQNLILFSRLDRYRSRDWSRALRRRLRHAWPNLSGKGETSDRGTRFVCRIFQHNLLAAHVVVGSNDGLAGNLLRLRRVTALDEPADLFGVRAIAL